MKKYILFFIVSFFMPFICSAAKVIEFTPLDSYTYFESYTFTESVNQEPVYVVHFNVVKSMEVRLSTCGSQGMTGIESMLTHSGSEIPLTYVPCGKERGIREATVFLDPSEYIWQVSVVAQKPGWMLVLSIESARPAPQDPDKAPLSLGTFFRDTEEMFVENSTWDYQPGEDGEGGVAEFTFSTVCSTDIFVNIDTNTRVVIEDETGAEVARLLGEARTVTLPKGRYRMLSDFMDDTDGSVFFALDVHLSEPYEFPKDTLLSDLGSLKSSFPILQKEHNYVVSRTLLSNSENSYIDAVQYYDGLGRPSHLLEKKSTPLGNSLISLKEYDALGRPIKEWLPVPTSELYLNPGRIASEAITFYSGDSRPYVVTDYEKSPLSRVLSQYGQGAAWKEHPVQKGYLVNGTTSQLRCSYYYMTLTGESTLARRGDYAAGELLVNKETDEDGLISLTFTNKEGQLILSREVNGSSMNDTYYVYDRFGNVCYVLPPQVMDNITTANLDLYAYRYKYDARNRCIEKKLPGAGNVTRYVHDKADRLILQQSGTQSKRNEWTFTLYDGLGNETIRGLCISATRPSFDEVVVKAERSLGAGFSNTGYEVANFGLTPASLLSVNYYDDYSYLDLASNAAHKSNLQYGFTGVASASSYDSRYVKYGIPEISARGMLTGTKVFMTDTNTSLLSSFYYDAKGNIVQSRSQNLMGGYEKDFFGYTFSGKMLKHLHQHSATGKATQTEVYTYVYDNKSGDNPERLLKVQHQLNSGTAVTLTDNTYDELGRLKNKKLHNSVNATGYEYNIRNWLKSITNSKFNQSLYYTDGPGTPCYNGNISSMTWQANTDPVRGYKYTYDKLNRLKNAVYGEGATLSSNANRFTEQVTGYDKNGNILGLKRYGRQTATTYGLIDNLSMTLNGNRLKEVKDFVTTPAYNGGFEFKDYTAPKDTGGSGSIFDPPARLPEDEFGFDSNGNLTKDLNKNISSIQYNVLNLPSKIFFKDGNSISYLYGADGVKYRTIHKIGGITTTTDYCGNVIYENGTQKQLLTEAGYISLSDKKYHYYLQDHQGNNRVVINQTGGVEETNHYYPFGGVFSSTSSVQPYKYNGKELDTKNGLNWYDYGARHYDAALGTFTTVDPSAESYYSSSPYAYCGNNPVNRIDPTGADWYEDDKGNLYWQEGRGQFDGYTHLGTSVSIQLGQNSYFNAYQNAGFMSNQPVSAFDVIVQSPKLQNQFLGKDSPLSEASKSELFNGLNSRSMDAIARPIGEAVFWNGSFQLGGPFAGKIAGTVVKGVGGIFTNLFAKNGITLWPAANAGRVVINGIEYTQHALERMQPVGTVFNGVNFGSRGIPPSVVENAIKYGSVTPGKTINEVVRTFENVRVITNPQGTRVITVIKIGK